MKKTVVINVVGLSQRVLGQFTPRINDFINKGKLTTINPMLPAVTCAVQSTYLTGKWPSVHGIVGNGWYSREDCEIKFWKQSNKLVQSEKVWESLKKEDESFTCANMFWWYNMYSSVDYSVTPRPNYLADGRKIPDIYTQPAGLRDELQNRLGKFPLFSFWGPKTSIKSSKWIADASIINDELNNPDLTFIYLPHLDYNLQRFGNDMKRIKDDLHEIDEVVGDLIQYYERQDANILMLSEYGITNVDTPVHVNRILRAHGFLQIRVERGLEILDAGASKAFAVADHQLAHIYLNNTSLLNEVRSVFRNVRGVEHVLSGDELERVNLSNDRCGDLVLVADKNSWFTYYFWEDDKKAPDYARMVDIHKKPGYDPVEMFTDPKDIFTVPKVLWKLIRKKLGFRTVMNIIPLNAELIRGSHGRIPEDKADHPVLISNKPELIPDSSVKATQICGIIKAHLKTRIYDESFF